MKNANLTVTDNWVALSLISGRRVFALTATSHWMRAASHGCTTRCIQQRTVGYVPTESSS